MSDEIDLETTGLRARYRVSEVTIMDKDEARVMDEPGAPQLTLITCYPFDSILPGTSLRYVVIAERIDASHEAMKAS